MVTLWGAAWQAVASAPSSCAIAHKRPQEPSFKSPNEFSETPMEARTGPCPISKGGGWEHPESITGEMPQPRVPRVRKALHRNIERKRRTLHNRQLNGDKDLSWRLRKD